MRGARSGLWLALGLMLAGCPHVQVKPAEPIAAPDAKPLPKGDVPVQGGVTHVVQAGETLYRIARGYGISAEEIRRAYAIVDPREVAVGTRLFIPGAVQTVPLPDLALDGAAVDASTAGEAGPHHASGCTGEHCLAWPLRGVIYARYGMHAGEAASGNHEGLDLAAPEGTPIAAAAAGRVLYAGEQPGYGTLVILEHPEGLVTLDAHNRENLVKDGQRVLQGQIIARVGQSGRTSGPHCHFEVRRGPTPVDPLRLLPAPSASPH